MRGIFDSGFAFSEVERELEQASSLLAEFREREQEARRVADSARRRRDTAIAEEHFLAGMLACRRWCDILGVMRILPVITISGGLATVFFLTLHSLTAHTATCVVVSGLMFVGVITVMAYVLLVRSDETVARQVADVALRLPVLKERAEQAERFLSVRRAEASRAESQRNVLKQALEKERYSVDRKCQMLMSQQWKEYRGSQFEDFLAEVFVTLGYEVQQTGQSGDHGVDLIVGRNGRTVAVQAKGYADSVGNAAVREAYAGKGIYECHACAVITNSRFTPKAVEAAEKLGCCLVHEDNFRAFVFGDVSFGV